MPTLPERIEAATNRGGSVTFVSGDDVERVEWSRLHEDARRMAAGLQSRGAGPGVHVALLGTTSRQLATAIQAVWLSGAAAVVLPLPMRLGSLEEFIAQTRARVRNADAALLVISPDLAVFYEAVPGDPPTILLDELTGDEWAYEPPKLTADDLAILQFTSGSTAEPKGVMLPHGHVVANLDGAAIAARLDSDDDVLVSWLPLYHDMGLIGLLTLPMVSGADLVLGAPQDFMASPARWMQWMSDFGGTATAGPNFSYVLAARALGRMSNLDLSRWRLALNGAEPVDPANVRSFCEAAAPHRFDARAAFPAFGMAEVVIAGAFPEPFTGLRTHMHEGRELAILGPPVPGLEFRICDGELEIRGPSVTPGYYKDEQATSDSFHDGWLRTGDMAYLVDGELVVCGRIKDVIIVGGRNIYPEDVERAAADVDGVRAGNVIAFGIPGRKGREAMVVVAETKEDDTGPIRANVARRVREAVGLPPEDVVLVAPGSLPKTSSGKLQRSLCKSRYLEESYTAVGLPR
jgi:fatty-acyl-CoA synthase